MKRENLTMLADFHEITMANGFLEHGMGEKTAVFDMFFRKVPDDGGFAIMAGVAQLVDYLKNLKFTDEDIEYLDNVRDMISKVALSLFVDLPLTVVSLIVLYFISKVLFMILSDRITNIYMFLNKRLFCVLIQNIFAKGLLI